MTFDRPIAQSTSFDQGVERWGKPPTSYEKKLNMPAHGISGNGTPDKRRKTWNMFRREHHAETRGDQLLQLTTLMTSVD